MTALLSEETKAREEIARIGASLFARGLTFGSTGNISIRLSNGHTLLTPTNVGLGDIEPSRLALMDDRNCHLSGDAPTKEAFLHDCIYCQRPNAGSVIHLHSSHSVAISILDGLDPDDLLPPLTAYYLMRVGRLPLIPYFAPGAKELARAVEARAEENHAMLLANHGPIVAGKSLQSAQSAIEELEETAKLFLMLYGQKIRPLTVEQANAIRSPDLRR